MSHSWYAGGASVWSGPCLAEPKAAWALPLPVDPEARWSNAIATGGALGSGRLFPLH